MRLVEKKCPNCKAALKFNDGDTVVKCEYCGSTYHIEKDEKKALNVNVDSAQFDRAFKLVGDVAKPMIGAFAVSQIIGVVVFVIIFAFAIFIGSNAIKQMNSNDGVFSSNTNTTTEVNELTKISQIDEDSLNIYYDESIKKLNSIKTSSSCERQGDWTRVGLYLLSPKKVGFVDLYDVYKATYKYEGTTVVLYAAVEYSDLELSDEGVVVDNFSGYLRAPMYSFNSAYTYAYGYDSLEQLYNKLIRSEINNYNVSATEGMYLGNAN